MKGLITLLFLIYLGCMPTDVWNSLSNKTQNEIATAYGSYYLNQKDYCKETDVIVKSDGESDKINFYAECNKVKI